MTTDPLDAAIAAIAKRQHGNITRRQLLDLGLTSKTINLRLADGRLHRVYAGVYAVGVPLRTPVDRAAAAVLACGRGAVLSHSSAVALWGWRKGLRAPFEITAPTKHSRPGITAHRATLPRGEIRQQLGIWVTSPARTILDVTPRLPRRELLRLIDAARIANHLKVDALSEVVAAHPRDPGAPALHQAMWPENPTRSEFERAFLAFVRAHGLPQPRVNARVGGYEVDMLFEAEGVVVELDGWGFHQGRASFEGDREKDADLLALGLQTVRMTWPRFRAVPEREAARLHAILRARRGRRAA